MDRLVDWLEVGHRAINAAIASAVVLTFAAMMIIASNQSGYAGFAASTLLYSAGRIVFAAGRIHEIDRMEDE